jgi:hypothetical protein
MGVGAEAHVGFEGPIFQIVARFPAGAREIGDLVARNAEGGEAFDGEFVEIGDLVVVGDVGGAVADAAEEALLAETAVLVDFEHVDGDVRGREALDPIERFAPTGGGLAGEAGDEVDIAVFDAGVAEDGDSAATISAVWRRPVRRISFSTKDWTPRLTRLMPSAAQARAFSGVMEPGAASMVASSQGRPGIGVRNEANSSGASELGVPPPR